MHSVGQAHDLLRAPFALEELGLSELPLLVCDLADLGVLGPEEHDALAGRLMSVRAVTVGIVQRPPADEAARRAEAFDLLVGPTGVAAATTVGVDDPLAATDRLATAVRACPQASVALVELLRHRAYERVPQGLVLESLTYSMLQSGPEHASWLASRGPADLPVDDDEPVLVDRVGPSLDVTLNRPGRANAFTAAMRDRLVEALRVAAVDPSIESVTIRGAGPSFCSGGDIAEFGTASDPARSHATRLVRSPGWWIAHLAADVQVHIHGACIGAGIELPAFASTVIAAPDTTIRLPEVEMGLVPGAGGTVSIPRRIGRQRTGYLALTGVQLDAAEAMRWGLVDRIE